MTDSHGSAPDDEPKTPMWLPALGAALFVGVALWWAVTPSAPPIVADAAASAVASASAAAPVAVAAAAPPHQAGAGSPMPMGSGRPMPSGMHLNPAIEDRMRKLHEGMDPRGPGRHP
jgi:Spy/CpxP family protein refolding chaperone